jgi:predicted CXXCH cytochrome family protein
MRRIVSTLLFSAVGSLLLAVPPATGIAGTAHDLTRTGLHTVTAATNVCIFCHAVHNSAPAGSQVIPSWNHTTTAQTFSMYSSSTLKGTVDSQPTGPSLACLSCHDGTVAMGALLNAPVDGGNTNYSTATGGVSNSTGLMISGGKVGTDLRSDHPISITYQDNLNASLQAASTLAGVKLYPSNATGSKVQCASCHDVHNYGTAGSTAPFLRVTMANSALCTRCHKM